jgi:hypothetical protein
MSARNQVDGGATKQVLDYLAAKHILAFRMNTGMARFDGRFVKFGVKGMADILAFFRGWNGEPVILPVWIETKAKDGRQSEYQKSFQALVESHGHRYIIARSIDDLGEL